jgi:cob(I)alamin adenosyltransferase
MAPYRGSFSTVLSQALRAAGLGSRVMVVQFLKGGVAQGPDRRLTLCGRLQWLRPDVACCLSGDAADQDDSIKDAVMALWRECHARLLSGDLDQLVLDELGLAVALGYLDEHEVCSTLEQRPGSMDVIITGPSIPDSVMDMADQVTELRRGF